MNDYQIYLKNYNSFMEEDIDDLLEIYLYGNNSYLKQVAKDVIINENKLDYYCDTNLLIDFISKIKLADLWKLSSSRRSLVRNLVTNEIKVISNKNMHRNKQCTLHLVK